ncbi:MAG: DUF3575 domain-containing protein [Flavobacteriaceae bacterium]
MKYACILIWSIGTLLWAQDAPLQVEIVKDNSFETAETFGDHEIRLNVLSLLAGPVIDTSYERIPNASSSYGLSMLINLSDNDFTYQNFALTPYYRFYFLDRKDYGARGTYVELFSSLSSVENYYDYYDIGYPYRGTSDNSFQISLGAGIGRKWVNRKGYSFELNFGVGRYLLNTDSMEEAHIRTGFSVGKRF